jgi:hypothetical protein
MPMAMGQPTQGWPSLLLPSSALVASWLSRCAQQGVPDLSRLPLHFRLPLSAAADPSRSLGPLPASPRLPGDLQGTPTTPKVSEAAADVSLSATSSVCTLASAPLSTCFIC